MRALLVLSLSAALGFAATACGSSDANAATVSQSSRGAAPRRRPDPLRRQVPEDRAEGVGTFTSIPWGFDTNTFWIEGESGVVAIDTQFLPSEAERAIDVIERETGKRIVLAIVLHPNPDKFNGADVFRARGARVVTSEQVLAQIPAVAEKRRRAFLSRYAPDYPDRDPTLEAFGSTTTTIREAGLELRLHVLGRGCSEAHVVAEWNGHVFGGDLIVSKTHAWLELGYVREWLARIDEIERLAPRRVHPGRGPSGGPELLAETRAYLARVLELVEAARPTGPATPETVQPIRERIVAEHPEHAYPVFLHGLAAVWSHEAERRASAAAP